MSSECQLYSYYRSSCAYRVRIALYLKNISFEYKPVHLLKNGGEQFALEYQTKNPLSQVPCFVHKGQKLTQSMAIIQYLDSVWSKPLLFPKNSYQKALVISLCEIINSGIQPLQNLSVLNYLQKAVQLKDHQKKTWGYFWIQKGLKALNTLLSTTKNPHFAVGDSITAVECFLIPQLYSARRFGVDLKPYIRLLEIESAVQEMPAFKKAHPDCQPDTPKVTSKDVLR